MEINDYNETIMTEGRALVERTHIEFKKQKNFNRAAVLKSFIIKIGSIHTFSLR